jgi:hypothetical protein
MSYSVTAQTGLPPDGALFQHRPPLVAAGANAVISEATRLMCAGAYLDTEFARQAIAELVEDESRAVVPSIGYDVNPVLRHCFQAYRMDVRRNVVLTVMLATGMLFAPIAVVAWILLGLVLALVRPLRRRLPPWKLYAVAGAVIAVCLAAPLLLSPFVPVSGAASTIPYRSSGSSSTVDSWLPYVLLLAAGLATEVYYRHRTFRILTTSLASGATHKAPDLPPGRPGRRVAAVSAAQWGNLNLQAAGMPYLGAGVPQQAWSMCLELTSRDRPGERVALDAVDLHAAVRKGLEAMRQRPLPENETVPGLVITDQVVATGRRRRDDSLLDSRTHSPYSEASAEAVEAIIRHPQGSLRYYLRTAVGATGKTIRTPSQRVVAVAQDQEIMVSTFLYLAVEGGMLYAEFVASVLYPIHSSFRLFDSIAPDEIASRALKGVLPTFARDVGLAPFRLVRAALGGGYHRRMERSARRRRSAYVYDYGARLSIRDLASDDELHNYLQGLDAAKYYKLVERSTSASILAYLRDHDIDTAEYEQRMAQVHNNSVTINGGNVSGSVAAGPNAKAEVRNG